MAGAKAYKCAMVMEGGGIHTDGEGSECPGAAACRPLAWPLRPQGLVGQPAHFSLLPARAQRC